MCSVKSLVEFKPLDSGEIGRYVDTGEPMDKAGAYAVQGLGAFMVRAVHGSYSNVVGLPLCEVIGTMVELGVIPEFPVSFRSEIESFRPPDFCRFRVTLGRAAGFGVCMSSIADNLRLVMDRIARAASKSGRAPEAVRLVAVSKTVSPERIQEAVNAGVQILGENYLQEAQEKMPKVSGPVCWHFIGHLQSRKAKDVVRDFDLIHSVDSVKLAREIDRRAEALW